MPRSIHTSMWLQTGVEERDLAAPLLALRRDGHARLGPVVAPTALAELRARVEELMHGRVRHQGLFFQHDSPTGRYEDLAFGAGWVGPSDDYRKLEKLE